MDYDLELDKVAAEIAKLGKKNPKVCLQFPDGLKPYAAEVVDELNSKLKTKNSELKTEFYIWASSNFGACDLPLHLTDLKFDLLVNFGHIVFAREKLKTP